MINVSALSAYLGALYVKVDFQRGGCGETQRTRNLPYNNAFARIRLRYLGNFLFLIGSSGRPSHESNYYSILYFVIAGPHHAGARRRRSYRIRSTEVTIIVK